MTINNINQQLILLHAYIGHIKYKWNPKMENYLYGYINNLHILNIKKTIQYLNKCKYFFIEILKNKGKFLIITEKKFNQNSNKYISYLNSTQLFHGFLTNFKLKQEIKQIDLNKIKYFKKQKKKFILSIPDIIFILNPTNNTSFINEINLLKIPLISLIDNINNPDLIMYPIPSNNENNLLLLHYIKFFNSLLKENLISNVKNFEIEYKFFKNIENVK